MQDNTTKLVIISGPVGVGKTTVGDALSGLLTTDNVAHTFIDLDGLSKTYPRPEGDPFGDEIALKNLSLVWSNAFEVGTRSLLIARVVETEEGAARIAQAVGADMHVVVQLNASHSVLLERVRKREIGDGRAWHERRTIELSNQLALTKVADIEIETDDKTLNQIAEEIRDEIHWL